MPDTGDGPCEASTLQPVQKAAAPQPTLMEMYRRLYARYGPQGWWPGDGPLDVVIGAILTQASSWTNVELAIDSLKRAGHWSLQSIHASPVEELAAVIRSCGYFNAKARKLKAFAAHVVDHYDGSLTALLDQSPGPLRWELLSIHGIGPETADDILTYAAGKPSFVIDQYTKRLLGRIGLAPQGASGGYDAYQDLFHRSLPLDLPLFQEYHALIDHHAKTTCAKTPKCSGCCLADVCAAGSAFLAGRSPASA